MTINWQWVSILLLLLALALPLGAAESEYTMGKDGLYYDAAGASYTRKDNWAWVAPSSYTYCGRCYSQAGYWSFKGYTYTAYSPPVITSKDPYWRNKLADALVIKTKLDADLVLAANEQNAFLETVQELGLSGSLKGSGLVPELAAPYRAKYAYPLPVGNTVYAQALVETQIYGVLDRNILAQQGSAFSRDALAMAERSHAINMATLDKDGANAARWAEILAKGITASRTLNASDAAPSATIRENYLTPAGPPVQAAQLGPRRQAAMRACIECHSESNPRGGFRISTFWGLPAEEQMRIVGKLVDDPKSANFMPRGRQRLASSTIMEFLPSEERARLER